MYWIPKEPDWGLDVLDSFRGVFLPLIGLRITSSKFCISIRSAETSSRDIKIRSVRLNLVCINWDGFWVPNPRFQILEFGIFRHLWSMNICLILPFSVASFAWHSYNKEARIPLNRKKYLYSVTLNLTPNKALSKLNFVNAAIILHSLPKQI